MKLWPVQLKWKKYPIWIEAENKTAAEGLAYYATIAKPMLSPHKTDNEPIALKGKKSD